MTKPFDQAAEEYFTPPDRRYLRCQHYTLTFSEERRAYCSLECKTCPIKDICEKSGHVIDLDYNTYKSVPKQLHSEVSLSLGC